MIMMTWCSSTVVDEHTLISSPHTQWGEFLKMTRALKCAAFPLVTTRRPVHAQLMTPPKEKQRSCFGAEFRILPHCAANFIACL